MLFKSQPKTRRKNSAPKGRSSRSSRSTRTRSGGRRTRKSKKSKKSYLKLIFKLLVVFLALLGLYAFYLNMQIKRTMESDLWNLPAEIYATIHQISLYEDKNTILARLNENGYRETKLIAQPTDFKKEGDNILLQTRAFPFPNDNQPERLIRLYFKNNQLVRIVDVKRKKRLKSFKLAPKLVDLWQSDKEDRLVYSLNRYPKLLIRTLLATEDRNFYDHLGVSPLAIMRAVIANVMAGNKVQGGSTITQQLVKNIFLSNERSFSRKLNEAIMAVLMEANYSKDKILETYLNEVYLGQMGDDQIHGFALASLFYFNRQIAEISLDQIALLVGLVKGPSLYNPWRNPKLALERRNVVLSIMLKNGVLNEETFNTLKQRPLDVQLNGQIRKSYPAFMQLLRQQLKENLGFTQLAGAKVFTTLDVEQQKAVEQSILTTMPKLQKQTKLPLESAMLVVNYHNGAVRAIVGGSNPNYAGLNRALHAKRQIGSLVKPSIYLTALSEPDRFSLKTLLANQPLSIPQPGGTNWQPKNYGEEFSEDVTMLEALTRSLNIPTVNLGLETGLGKIIQTQQAMGWSNIPTSELPATLLGTYSLSPFEVSKLFQTIANYGKSLPLYTIEYITNDKGDVAYSNFSETQQVVPPEASMLTLFAMQNVVKNGTGRSVFYSFPKLNIAGKTGTSNRSRDAWWVGIDNDNLATIWVGMDDNSATTKKITGSSVAVPIYKEYLRNHPTRPLKLRVLADIEWASITSSNRWNCESEGEASSDGQGEMLVPFWKTAENNCQKFKENRSFWEVFGF